MIHSAKNSNYEDKSVLLKMEPKRSFAFRRIRRRSLFRKQKEKDALSQSCSAIDDRRRYSHKDGDKYDLSASTSAIDRMRGLYVGNDGEVETTIVQPSGHRITLPEDEDDYGIYSDSSKSNRTETVNEKKKRKFSFKKSFKRKLNNKTPSTVVADDKAVQHEQQEQPNNSNTANNSQPQPFLLKSCLKKKRTSQENTILYNDKGDEFVTSRHLSVSLAGLLGDQERRASLDGLPIIPQEILDLDQDEDDDADDEEDYPDEINDSFESNIHTLKATRDLQAPTTMSSLDSQITTTTEEDEDSSSASMHHHSSLKQDTTANYDNSSSSRRIQSSSGIHQPPTTQTSSSPSPSFVNSTTTEMTNNVNLMASQPLQKEEQLSSSSERSDRSSPRVQELKERKRTAEARLRHSFSLDDSSSSFSNDASSSAASSHQQQQRQQQQQDEMMEGKNTQATMQPQSSSSSSSSSSQISLSHNIASATFAKTTAVSFTNIEIREYERVVGDNPSVSSGVPLSIGWKHGKMKSVNVDDYENHRKYERRLVTSDLLVSPTKREFVLRDDWNESMFAIRQATKDAAKARTKLIQSQHKYFRQMASKQKWRRLQRFVSTKNSTPTTTTSTTEE